jgi:tetratricopeptide (TPR) repeat protein/O-antigen ligase
MEKSKAAFENIETPSKFDTIIEWLLGSLLIFMPLLFGARNAWTEEVVIALSGCILISFLLKLVVDGGQAVIWSRAYVPIGLFVLIVTVQLIPVSASFLHIVSPNTVKLRSELLGGLPQARELLKAMPVTLYANDTRHDLRLVLSVLAVFFVVINIFRRPGQIKRLLIVIALIGGLVALIALAQDVFGNGKIYWFVPTPQPKALSGPFINHNHFGQFINLSIGAAIGWLYVKVHEGFSGRQLKPSDVMDYLSSREARILWLLVAIMGFGAATVFVSLTRGGMVSMLIAGIFTAWQLISRKPLAGRGWIMVIMAIVAFAGILLVGFDAVYDRFATLYDFNAYKSRWQNLKDITASFVQFPILGTGLGTHSVVYPMYQSVNVPVLFTHAENEYAQAFEETGLTGFILLAIFGAFVWSGYFRSIHTTETPICSAAYGLGFGLLAVLIHSFSDYGQHIPANAFLSAIFCALLINLGRWKKPGTTITLLPKTISRVIVLLCIGIWLWTLIGANNARIAEANWKKALAIEKGLAAKDWQGAESEYAALISYADMATQYEPDNKTYHYAFNLYRWYSINKAKDSDIEDAEVPEYSMPLVSDIVSGFNKTIAICPTYGPSYSVAGQIEKFVLFNDAGSEKIRRGYFVAPCDAIAGFVAGQLDVLEGKTEDSIAKFEKAVKIDASLFKDIVNIYINHLSRPYLAISAAGDDIDRLRYVAGVLEDMQYNDLAKQAHQKANWLLEIKCLQPGACAGDFASLAGVYSSQQANEKAIEYYQRALELDYGQVYWRYELAKLLAKTNRIPEALHEARICVRLMPQFKAAEKLTAELSVNPASFVR